MGSDTVRLLQGRQMLELYEGCGKELAIMIAPWVTEYPCDLGKHCAHHGAEYNPCCRCGAIFAPVEQVRAARAALQADQDAELRDTDPAPGAP